MTWCSESTRWSYRPVPRDPLTDFAPSCPLTVSVPLGRRRHPAPVATPASLGQELSVRVAGHVTKIAFSLIPPAMTLSMICGLGNINSLPEACRRTARTASSRSATTVRQG